MITKRAVYALCYLAVAALPMSNLCSQPQSDLASRARAYYGEKPAVAIVLRIEGGISAGDYLAFLRDAVEDVDTSVATADHSRYIESREDFKLAVLRSVEGDLPATIQISRLLHGAYAIKLAQPAVVFFEKQDGQFVYDYCDVFPDSLFPPDLLRTGTASEFVDYILENRLYACLKQP